MEAVTSINKSIVNMNWGIMCKCSFKFVESYIMNLGLLFLLL